jgi:hypothetical protein
MPKALIRFFQKIRKEIIGKGPSARYLLYAIGEILLVVIGILIALQVDNWNEERKKQREITQLLLDIEQDLLQNYELADQALDFYRMQDSIVKRIARGTLTKEDYENSTRLTYLVSNWEYYLPAEKNIDQFVESEKRVPPDYKPIIEGLKKVQSFSAVLDDVWANLDENIGENTKFITSFNWYVKNDSLSNAKRQAFFLQDEAYHTTVFRYWVNTQNYYDKITRYRAQTMAALATIKQITDKYSDDDIQGLFLKMGMKPFEAYPCSVSRTQLEPLKALRSSELYANLTEDILYFELSNNKGQGVTEFTIPPNTITTIPGNEYFGLDGDNNTLARVSDKAGNCIGTFGAFENGFLFVTEDHSL